MTAAPHKRAWRMFGATVRGADHAREGRANQDAIKWLPSNGLGPPLILAVSDGLGHHRHPRSQIGSEFAVSTAAELLNDIVRNSIELSNPEIRKKLVKLLPTVIVGGWSERVRQHLDSNPFDEGLSLDEPGFIPTRVDVLEQPLIAYGATLLAVLLVDSSIAYVQLGDGDIITVNARGEVERPLEIDTTRALNQPAALCLPDAAAHCQVVVHSFDDRERDSWPVMILLSTDGYSNSFESDEEFRKVGSDLCGYIADRGVDYVKDNLEGWLQATSERGSGDDVTLGVLYAADIAAAASDMEASKPEPSSEQLSAQTTVEGKEQTTNAAEEGEM